MAKVRGIDGERLYTRARRVDRAIQGCPPNRPSASDPKAVRGNKTVNARRQLGIRAKLFFAFAAVLGHHRHRRRCGLGLLMFSQVRDLFHWRRRPQHSGDRRAHSGCKTETQALAGSAPTLLAW